MLQQHLIKSGQLSNIRIQINEYPQIQTVRILQIRSDQLELRI